MTGAVRLAESSFSLAERDRRHRAVRALMRARGLECLILPHNTGDWDNFQPDLRYLTCIGGGGVAASLVFPLEGEPIAAVREGRRIEWWKASQDWINDIRSPPKFIWSQFFADALTERGFQASKIGVVGLATTLRDVEGNISYGEFTALTKALPNAAFEDATDIVYRARKTKSAEEIGMIEKAQICADRIQSAFRSVACPGATEHQIYSALFAAHIAAGGEVPCMILFSADKRFWQTHVLPTFRVVERDDVLTLEAEPKYYGYMAQAVDSISFRPLSVLERKLFDVSAQAFRFLLSELRPGRPYADVIRACEAHVAKFGCVLGRTMGHGLGLGQDGPLTTPAGRAGGLSVEEGDCLVIKPWIADRADSVCVRVGGTVVVGKNGARKLGAAELEPLIGERG